MKEVIPRKGQNSNLCSVIHGIQKAKGGCFTHFQKDGRVTTYSAAVAWKLSTISIREPTQDKRVITCRVPSKYLKVAQTKIRQGIEEQRELQESNKFILCSIGTQEVNAVDKERMYKSASTCHENDERDIAWDDVTGAALNPSLVRKARQKIN